MQEFKDFYRHLFFLLHSISCMYSKFIATGFRGIMSISTGFLSGIVIKKGHLPMKNLEIKLPGCHVMNQSEKKTQTDNKRFKTTCESEGNALNQNLRGVYQYKPLSLSSTKKESGFAGLPAMCPGKHIR
jgi:hypothetical protein